MEDEAGAKADYDAALKANESFAPAHYYLGMHFRQKGDRKQALTHLAAAVDAGKDTPVGQAAARSLAELKSGKK
jgi:hypothetical protein